MPKTILIMAEKMSDAPYYKKCSSVYLFPWFYDSLSMTAMIHDALKKTHSVSCWLRSNEIKLTLDSDKSVLREIGYTQNTCKLSKH